MGEVKQYAKMVEAMQFNDPSDALDIALWSGATAISMSLSEKPAVSFDFSDRIIRLETGMWLVKEPDRKYEKIIDKDFKKLYSGDSCG